MVQKMTEHMFLFEVRWHAVRNGYDVTSASVLIHASANPRFYDRT